jgi:MFS family permease
MLTQVAGGVWADRFGGKLVLGAGVVWWSLATAVTPAAAAAGLPALLAARFLMGVGEGVAMPAMNNMLSRWAGVGCLCCLCVCLWCVYVLVLFVCVCVLCVCLFVGVRGGLVWRNGRVCGFWVAHLGVPGLARRPLPASPAGQPFPRAPVPLHNAPAPPPRAPAPPRAPTPRWVPLPERSRSLALVYTGMFMGSISVRGALGVDV